MVPINFISNSIEGASKNLERMARASACAGHTCLQRRRSEGLQGIFEAVTDPGNTRSRQLLERNAFLLPSLFKENFLRDGEFQELAVYSS